MSTSGSKRVAAAEGGGQEKRLRLSPSPSSHDGMHVFKPFDIPLVMYLKISKYLDLQSLPVFCVMIGKADGDKVWQNRHPNNPYAVSVLNGIRRKLLPPPTTPSNHGTKKLRIPDLRPEYKSYLEDEMSINIGERCINLMEKEVSVIGRVDVNLPKRTETKLRGIEALMSATSNLRMWEWGHEAMDIVTENIQQRDPNLTDEVALTNVTLEDVTEKRLRLNRGIPALIHIINPKESVDGVNIKEARAKLVEILKSSKGRIGQTPPTDEDIEIADIRTIPQNFEDLEVAATGLFPETVEEYNFIGKAFGMWFGFDPKVCLMLLYLFCHALSLYAAFSLTAICILHFTDRLLMMRRGRRSTSSSFV